jgi:predicted alpha/beta hydrolase family esterase
LLESFDEGEKAKAVILVAGFAKDLGIPQIKGFVDKDFDWKKIRQKAGRFIVINSDNDPFIGLSEGGRIAKLLGAEFIVEHGAGHINEGSGFTKYERLMGMIRGVNE